LNLASLLKSHEAGLSSDFEERTNEELEAVGGSWLVDFKRLSGLAAQMAALYPCLWDSLRRERREPIGECSGLPDGWRFTNFFGPVTS
jgi:hypothetical protein